MSFSELIGQPELKKRLGTLISSGPGHAYLFLGPVGSGRHSFGFELAKAILCDNPREDGACGQCAACRHFSHKSHPDFIQLSLDGKEKNIRVERVRRICAELSISPQLGTRKVYLIDADDLNEQGQNALLKSLEEPPEHITFILIAAGTDKLLPTVLSRVSILQLSRYSHDEIKEILARSGYTDNEYYEFWVRYANGIPGSALSLAGNSGFNELRQQVIEFYFDLPDKSRTQLLYQDFFMFDDQREEVPMMLSLLSGIIRDQSVLEASGNPELLINRDIAEKLKTIMNKKRYGKHLFTCHQAILDASRAIKMNVNFEVTICQLLLSLRKELKNA